MLSSIASALAVAWSRSLQRQIELIGMKLGGQPLALQLETLRLTQQPTQPIIKFDQLVALGNRCIAHRQIAPAGGAARICLVTPDGEGTHDTAAAGE